MSREDQINRLERMAKRMRLRALKMALDAGNNGAHLGPAMSCMEILAVLYGDVMRFNTADPEWDERDRLMVSKAHCVLAYYTALAEAGFLSDSELDTFEKNGTCLAGHPAVDLAKGIEYSGGSLGQALPVSVGMAIDAKQRGRQHKVYVLLGDGECDEGSNWEAFMAAAHFRLDNLVVILDKNQLQYDGPTEEIMKLGDMGAKMNAFGWLVTEVDGHKIGELLNAFAISAANQPHMIIANTVKGRGVSFMESVREWHHARLTLQQYEAAVAEIEAGGGR